MEKRVLLLFMVLICSSFVLAAWGDVNTGDGDVAVDSGSSGVDDDFSISENILSGIMKDRGVAETGYTKNFYLAVGLGAFGVLIVLYIIYLIVRGPKVHWKKRKPVKL